MHAQKKIEKDVEGWSTILYCISEVTRLISALEQLVYSFPRKCSAGWIHGMCSQPYGPVNTICWSMVEARPAAGHPHRTASASYNWQTTRDAVRTSAC